MPDFKYKNLLKTLPFCPPEKARLTEPKVFYRFVHEDKTDERSFQPTQIIWPDREPKTCTGYALSLYSTEHNAKKAYARAKKRNPQVGEDVGTWLACGEVNRNDGVRTPRKSTGHVNLFEYEGARLQEKFQWKEELP